MNDNSSTQWQLPLTIEQQLWTVFLLLLFFFSFIMLGPHVPIFRFENWGHWGTAAQQDQHRRPQGASQTPDQLERNGCYQAAAPYPQQIKHELFGTIRSDRPTGMHLDHPWMDANHNTRISGVWEPLQGNPSALVDDTNFNQQRRIEVFTIDRWGSATESSPCTEGVDLSEYEVHIEDTESMLISKIHPLSHSLTTLCR